MTPPTWPRRARARRQRDGNGAAMPVTILRPTARLSGSGAAGVRAGSVLAARFSTAEAPLPPEPRSDAATPAAAAAGAAAATRARAAERDGAGIERAPKHARRSAPPRPG